MNNPSEFDLKPEQKFALKVLYDQAQRLTKQQAIEMLIELKRQDYAKTNFWVNQIKHGQSS